jgi:GDP-L-fucose synthase
MHSDYVTAEVGVNKIFIAGHQGMVGSAIAKKLGEGYIHAKKRVLDLQRQDKVESFFDEYRPEIVILAAAKVGGIHANNTYRAEFIYNNLQIQNNIIHSSWLFGVKKLIFLGSSCIYPKFAEQPIKEEYLLSSPLEYTNEPYSVAKIAGIKMCESYHKQYGCNFLAVMPCNLYGPNDNFHNEDSHVLPALIRRFHEAKQNNEPHVEVWGTGKAQREFMHVDDLADAVVFALRKIDAEHIYSQNISHLNIGTGQEISIAELAKKIADTVGYEGEIRHQLDKPDGTLRKLLDVSRLEQFGWKYKISLENGLNDTYGWYNEQDAANLRL